MFDGWPKEMFLEDIGERKFCEWRVKGNYTFLIIHILVICFLASELFQLESVM